ncbi:phospholipase D-like domain-containing protein [Lentisalinibacter salinarum]|uniref:phospholipase D-like domain-containing protein n=1 Tax=Lentisalinibacter salinarum TaxID=2992239 RepID=UPI003863518B
MADGRSRTADRNAQFGLGLLALGLLVLGPAGCATLPVAEPDLAIPANVEFQGQQGILSEARGEQLLGQLERETATPDMLRTHLAYEQTIAVDSPLVLGNKVTLLQNGPDTHAAMLEAIRSAVDHVNLETYIFDDGELGQEFAALLLQKQASGVQVNILYDSVGGLLTPESFFEELREGGIAVIEFNPVNPLAEDPKTWRANNRDHRKQLVVDGRIAFIGGVNISDGYSSVPLGKPAPHVKRAAATDSGEGWRDTHIQIEGPVVAEFQRLFLDSWTRQTEAPPTPSNYYPELSAKGDGIVRAIGSRAEEKASPIYMTLVSAITRAQTDVHLTVAYFGPDAVLLKALTDTAQRGVKVKLVLPSHTDSAAIFHLGRSHYATLLKAGVEIHERQGAVMHAKTAVIDSVWSTIGSSNLDWRSFVHNDEINAVVLGGDFAGQMNAMFAEDLAESEQISLAEWRRRSWWLRIKEGFSRLGAYWL